MIFARVLSLVLTFVLLTTVATLSFKLRLERTDLSATELADRSFRTIDPANYTRAGQRLLRIASCTQVALLVSGVTALWLFGLLSF
jgi:hypothetical protein